MVDVNGRSVPTTALGPTVARARSDAADQRWAMQVDQAGTDGPAGGLKVTSANSSASAGHFTGDITVTGDLILGGETVTALPAWVDATLPDGITSATAVAVGSRLERGRVFLRGTLAWVSATIAGGSTLLTLGDSSHFPTTVKTFTVRSGPTSNIVTQVELSALGVLTNVTSFGTTTTADVGLDGLSWDLS